MPDWNLEPLDSTVICALRPEDLFGLTGKVAIVTGASGGLGAWLSAGLAAAGATVVLSDHPGAIHLEATAATIREGGGTVEILPFDLLADGAAEAIVSETIARLGRLDILINNAGVNRRERIFDVSRESWDLIAAIDLRIPYELSRAAARHMQASGQGGSIIHIASLNNAIGLDGVSVYGAHKAGLCQLAKAMSVEWLAFGIRTNAICPGFMLTPLSKPLWDDPVRGRWLLERSPLKRPGYPRELVGLCQLLASQAGSFISGQTLYADGGWLAGTSWDDVPAAGALPDEKNVGC
jgi:NAD(P)-dependent dehydrogenase (short-subunit alcohol dehydrogenase family)